MIYKILFKRDNEEFEAEIRATNKVQALEKLRNYAGDEIKIKKIKSTREIIKLW